MIIDEFENEREESECERAYIIENGKSIETYRKKGEYDIFHCKYTGLDFWLIHEGCRVKIYIENYGYIHENFKYDDEFFICCGCCICFHIDDMRGDGVCNDCYLREEEREEEECDTVIPCESEKKKNEIACHEKGEIVRHVRRFGIELEVGGRLNEIAEYLPAGWSIVNDGSIKGKEFVSNILQGKAGEEIVKKFCKYSVEYSRITKSDGFHVHIDASDYKRSVKRLKNVIGLYSLIQDLFFEYVPKSRLGNRYCKKIDFATGDVKKRYDIDNILYGTSSVCTIKDNKRNKYDDARYYWLNVHSLYYRGTLEVRSHSGTMDYRKILEWVNIHGLLVGLATKKDFQTYYELLYQAKLQGIDRLQDTLFYILKLPESSREYFIARRAKFQGVVVEGQGEV
jgi:hypothetical protein